MELNNFTDKDIKLYAGEREGEPDWSKIDGSKLRKSCFLVVLDSDKKSTWKLPYKWIKNPTGTDENGIYIGGTELIHRGGVIAASNALVGARGGVDLTPEQQAHAKSVLRRLRAELDLPDIFKELETEDIDGVEIFQAGANETQDYTVDDLDQIVEANNELKGEIKPPVKLGHNENQKILDGMPAAGWLTNFCRVGSKIFADLKSVPGKIAKLIRAGGYRRVSVEVGKNYLSEAGKKYPKLIRAIALLGADIPRIKTLDDIVALYSKGDNDSFEGTDTFSFDVNKKGGDKRMDKIEITKEEFAEMSQLKAEKEKLMVELDGLKKKFSELEGQLKKKDEEIKGAEGKATASEGKANMAEKNLAAVQTQQKEAKIDKFVEDRKRAGAWLPAWDENFKKEAAKMDDVKKEKFTEDGKEVEKTQLDRHLDMWKGIPDKSLVNFSEVSKDGKKKDGEGEEERFSGDDVVGKELHGKAVKYMEEHKGVSYKEAVLKVADRKDSVYDEE